MTRVLVTGATGFVGRQLCENLAAAGYLVRAALRTDRALPAWIAEKTVTGDISGATRWGPALENVDLVIHAAARTHVLYDSPANSRLYVETNSDATQALAAESARSGVRRFVYLSSVKVNGEGRGGRPYTAGDEPQPQDAYGSSKWLAEQRLWQIVARTSLPAAVVRAPLVYGVGVGANFLRLLRWIDRERLLPLGAVRNQRSLVSVWTLCDLLSRLLVHPAAVNGTWMVSDGEDLSTPELVRRIAHLMGRRARLLSVPPSLLRVAGALAGKGAEMLRLCASLTVDIAATRERLGWGPPLSAEEALARTVSWYRSTGGEPR
ncbi:MAG TPA: NAD-dependent epimerase/dehydratase family protein [Steroidobacteraceae bacterium]|jgi:nucleoside-diphosphate-sugar epimerase|nr:NAD-dependent epimerase/dehydratase family protein [Steroidobacteraceae bacterium]